MTAHALDHPTLPGFDSQLYVEDVAQRLNERPVRARVRLGASALTEGGEQPRFTPESQLSPEIETIANKLRTEVTILDEFDKEDRSFRFVAVAKPGGAAREAILRRDYGSHPRAEAKEKLNQKVSYEQERVEIARNDALAQHAKLLGVSIAQDERDHRVTFLDDDDLAEERVVREHRLYRLAFATASRKSLRDAHKTHLQAQIEDLYNPRLAVL